MSTSVSAHLFIKRKFRKFCCSGCSRRQTSHQREGKRRILAPARRNCSYYFLLPAVNDLPLREDTNLQSDKLQPGRSMLAATMAFLCIIIVFVCHLVVVPKSTLVPFSLQLQFEGSGRGGKCRLLGHIKPAAAKPPKFRYAVRAVLKVVILDEVQVRQYSLLQLSFLLNTFPPENYTLEFDSEQQAYDFQRQQEQEDRRARQSACPICNCSFLFPATVPVCRLKLPPLQVPGRFPPRPATRPPPLVVRTDSHPSQPPI